MSEGRISDPRVLAYRVLRAVDAEDAYANLALAAALRDAALSPRDAALATELVAGTLRRRGAYEAILTSLVKRPLDADVRDVLLLGAHQVLSMRVPAHAAVATSVGLARSVIGHKVTGLVNAVLRKVAERSLEQWLDDLDANVSIRFSHPQWIVDVLGEAYGADPTPLLQADNEPPRVCLVARPGLASVDELLEVAGSSRHPSSPLGVELAGGDPSAIAAVREGRAGVQDAGSQVVAWALAVAELASTGETWLDLCAGPGGKASLLAALAAEHGAYLLANERAPHRAELVAKALRAVPRGTAATIAGDGTRPAWRTASFDRVLVDAPCSGLGALRRRPESRWRRQASDIADLVPLQRALLETAIESTRPGGVIGYATCSPVLAETVEVVEAVLATRDDVVLEDAPALVPWLERAACRSMPEALQLWPNLHRTDAMFLALLRRRG